jgi:hypothetical protein
MSPRKFDPDQPVPLVLAPNDFEAQVISHALNAEGVRAMVAGSHGQVWAGPGNPLSPVSVIVKRADRMEALRVLRRLRAEANGKTIDDDEPIRAVDHVGKCIVCGYDMSGLDETAVCPECGTNLADDSAVFQAAADASLLRSAAFRLLLVVIILGALVAGVISGVQYFLH